MRKILCLILLNFACAPYEENTSIRQSIKAKNEIRQAADAEAAEDARQAAEAARLAAIEAKYEGEAVAESLRLRQAESDLLMKNLEGVSGSTNDKLSQFPKLVFQSQLALDQTSVREIRAQQDQARMKESESGKKDKDAGDSESGVADEPSDDGAALVEETRGDAGKTRVNALSIPLSLVDHEKGSCLIFSLDEKPFIAGEIPAAEVTLSPNGRILMAKSREQSSEMCQAYFEQMLPTRSKADYFSLYVGFVGFPQD